MSRPIETGGLAASTWATKAMASLATPTPAQPAPQQPDDEFEVRNGATIFRPRPLGRRRKP